MQRVEAPGGDRCVEQGVVGIDENADALDMARKEGKEQEAELKRQRKLVADRMVREKHSEELAYKMHSAR